MIPPAPIMPRAPSVGYFIIEMFDVSAPTVHGPYSDAKDRRRAASEFKAQGANILEADTHADRLGHALHVGNPAYIEDAKEEHDG